jgi:hypothetical protein
MGPIDLLFPRSEKEIMELAKLTVLASLILLWSRAEPPPSVQTSNAMHTSLSSAAADAEHDYRASCTPFGFCWPHGDNGTLFVFSR